MSLEDWSTEAVDSLFTAAEGTDFRLFFSFDMTHFTDPSQFLPILEQYVSHDNYYLYGSKPFVSTFDGGQLTFGSSSPNAGWQSNFKDALSDAGVDVFFVPDFDDASGYLDSFFDIFTVVDGAFSWESAWPYEDAGFANVSDTVDNTMIDAAHAASKIYMMREFFFPSL
jgi:glucan endo-1,3-alpha-glucosidase